MLYPTLEKIATGVAEVGSLYERQRAAEFATDLDAMVDEIIGLDELADVVDSFLSAVKRQKEITSKKAVELFIEKEQQSITRRGKTVGLAKEYWPSFAWKDLLPEGVDPEDPDYETTVAQCMAAGKSRLLVALKESANFSHLVQEAWNANSIRSALTGESAERDALDVPILPPELEGKVELNPRDCVRVRKAGKKAK